LWEEGPAYPVVPPDQPRAPLGAHRAPAPGGRRLPDLPASWTHRSRPVRDAAGTHARAATEMLRISS